MPIIPGAPSIKPISMSVGKPDIVNSAAIANEGVQSFTGQMGNAMWSVAQVLNDNEARDYVNTTERDYELKRQKTLDSYLARIDDNGRIPETGETLDEAMGNWSKQEMEGYEVNAPSMKAYRETKAALTPYHLKTSADSLAVRLKHVRERQLVKIADAKQQAGLDIQNYIPTGGKSRIALTEEIFSKEMSHLERKVGTIINESQYADLEKEFGSTSVVSLLDSALREEEYGQMGDVLGYPYLNSPEAQAIMEKELGLSAGEIKALRNKAEQAKKKGEDLKRHINAQEINVIGTFENVRQLSNKEPHYLHNYLTPKEKDYYLRGLLRGMKEQKEKKDAFLMDRYKNMNIMQANGEFNARGDAELKNLLKDIANSDMFEDFEKVNMGGTLISNRMQGRIGKDMKQMNMAQADGVIRDVPNQAQDFAVQYEELMKEAGIDIKRQASIYPQFLKQQTLAVQENLYAEYSRFRDELAKDSSQTSMNYDKKTQFEWGNFLKEPSPQNYHKFLKASLAYQERVQVPSVHVRYVSKGYSQEIKGKFDELVNSNASSEAFNSAIGSLESQFGDSTFSQKAFDQLASDKAIPAEVNIARTLPIGAPERSLILKDASVAKQLQEASGSSDLLKMEDVRRKVEASPTFTKMREVLIEGKYPNNIQYITDLQEVLTRRAYVENYKHGKLNDGIITKVVQDFFLKFNHVSNTSTSQVAIPIKTLSQAYERRKKNTYNHAPEDADIAIDLARGKLLERIMSDDYEIVLSDEQRRRIQDKLGMSTSDEKLIQDTFKKSLRENSKMVGTTNHGAFLHFVDPESKSSSKVIIKDKKGKQDFLVAPWHEIYDDPDLDKEIWKKKNTMYNIKNFFKGK